MKPNPHGLSTLSSLHRRRLRKRLRGHALLMVPILVVGALLTGLPMALVVPIYATVLLMNLPFGAAAELDKDRQEGTLEFLCGLPIEGGDLAMARTLALVEGGLAVGLLGATTLVLFFHGAMSPIRLALGSLGTVLSGLLTVIAASTLFTMLSLRFRPEYIMAAIVLAMVLPAAILQQVSVPIPEISLDILGRPETLLSVTAWIGVLAGITAVVSFILLARAFERCARNPSLAQPRAR